MEFDLDIPCLGDLKLARFGLEAELRIGDGVVSILKPLKRGYHGFSPALTLLKKAFRARSILSWTCSGALGTTLP
jgi:hypothetical protein